MAFSINSTFNKVISVNQPDFRKQFCKQQRLTCTWSLLFFLGQARMAGRFTRPFKSSRRAEERMGLTNCQVDEVKVPRREAGVNRQS